MADTAAFFAKKKKAGKKYKSFNANKIDVASVTTITHVDAPEVSESILGDLKIGSDDDGQWADPVGKTRSINLAVADSKVAELMDMQAINLKRETEDDVAERLRIEETKAQLARAKEGMAQEAERLEREKKDREGKAAAKITGSSTATVGEGGGKWVPSHMRAGGSLMRGPATMDRVGKPNITDQELFPDLADADNILAEKERQEKLEQERMSKTHVQSVAGATRAPSGWGDRMGSSASVVSGSGQRQPLNLVPRSKVTEEAVTQRKPLNLAPPSKKSEDTIEPTPVSSPPVSVEDVEKKPNITLSEAIELNPASETTTITTNVTSDEKNTDPSVSAPTEVPTAETSAAPKKVVLKKKKKDLSTFHAKASS